MIIYPVCPNDDVFALILQLLSSIFIQRTLLFRCSWWDWWRCSPLIHDRSSSGGTLGNTELRLSSRYSPYRSTRLLKISWICVAKAQSTDRSDEATIRRTRTKKMINSSTNISIYSPADRHFDQQADQRRFHLMNMVTGIFCLILPVFRCRWTTFLLWLEEMSQRRRASKVESPEQRPTTPQALMVNNDK